VRPTTDEDLLLVDEAPGERLHVLIVPEVGKGGGLELEGDR
jgi:hypothetical protein